MPHSCGDQALGNHGSLRRSYKLEVAGLMRGSPKSGHKVSAPHSVKQDLRPWLKMRHSVHHSLTHSDLRVMLYGFYHLRACVGREAQETATAQCSECHGWRTAATAAWTQR